jgi:leucyl aminopeptidase
MLESTPFEIPVFRPVTDPVSEKTDVVVVGLTESGALTPTLSAIDGLTDKWISRLIELGQLRGKQGELSLLASPLSDGPVMILVVGLGNKPVTRSDAFESSASAIRKLVDRKRDRVVVSLAESFPEEFQEQIVAGAVSACEVQALYQADPPIEVPASIEFSGIGQAVIDRGAVIGQSINQTRRLVNEPPAMVYPASFAERVEELAAGTELQIEVWDEN